MDAIVAMVGCLALAPMAAAGPIAGFQGLGDLPGDVFQSNASAISADGTVVVGSSRSAAGFEAFRWTAAGGMVGLGDLPGGTFLSTASGVSADGSVVVGESKSHGGMFGTEAFRWTQQGGMVPLGYLPGGSEFSQAHAVSADGSTIAGASHAAAGTLGFRWTQAGGMVSMNDLTGQASIGVPYGVSADGAAVVGDAFGNSAEAYRWSAADGLVGMGFLGTGDQSIAGGVSDDGAVVFGRSRTSAGSTADWEAFRWTQADGIVGLGQLAFPGGTLYSSAADASVDGSVIVGRANHQSYGYRAFIWDAANGMRDLQDVLVNDHGLDLTGWNLGNATGVSADGLTIVGTGTNPFGASEAWIATLPEPGMLGLLAVGGVLVARRHRRAPATRRATAD